MLTGVRVGEVVEFLGNRSVVRELSVGADFFDDDLSMAPYSKNVVGYMPRIGHPETARRLTIGARSRVSIPFEVQRSYSARAKLCFPHFPQRGLKLCTR